MRDVGPPSASISPDPTALRALAHPARLRMLGLLRADGPATASQLAERMGLNSGATSYHLRQLEQFGYVVEDHERGNRRDRWWRAVHQNTRTSLAEQDDPDARAVHAAFRRTAAGQQVAAIQAAAAELEDLPRAWADVATNSDWVIWLTPRQADVLVSRLGDLLDAALAEEPAEQERPDDAELFAVQLHAFPFPGRLASPQGSES